jgi:hypothetical protein
VRADESDQTRGPHSSRHTLAADVAKGEDDAVACLLHREKVTGQVPHREYLAGDLDLSQFDETRGA